MPTHSAGHCLGRAQSIGLLVRHTRCRSRCRRPRRRRRRRLLLRRGALAVVLRVVVVVRCVVVVVVRVVVVRCGGPWPRVLLSACLLLA